MADNKDKKVLNVPALRFPEFSGEWEKYVLTEFVERVTRRNKGNECKLPLTISAQYGLVDQITFFNKIIASDDMSNYYLLTNGDFAYNKSYSSEYPWGAIKRLDRYEYGALSSLYICFRPLNHVSSDFLTHYFETKKWHQGISEIAVEGARNHGLLNIGIQDFFATKHYLPQSILEQEKIACFLNLIEERIRLQNKIIEKLETLIKGIRHNVFQQLRKDVGFNSTIGDILSFEQPQRYIVSSTEYSDDSSCTPVLTANKAFILGYTTETDGIYSKGDCIIIDDFTLDCKYVSFPFKIKSSAIKILTAENKYILRFIYEYLKSLDISTEEHKRHYITEIQPSSCILPDDKTLTTIALMFESITNKLENEQSLALMLNKQKQYLLSKMFI